MPTHTHTEFDPALYLRTYYSSGQPARDERANLAALTDVLHRPFDTALEVGCGPTLYMAIPLARCVREIHLSDYLPANLAEVRKWLEAAPDAHDWDAYLRATLELEGTAPTPAAVTARAAALRERVTELLACDLRRGDPLGGPRQYDLVTSFYTAECAARDRTEWEAILRRLAALVRPGGTLVTATMRRCTGYLVGDTRLATVPVDESDLRAILPAMSLCPERSRVTVSSSPEWAEHGFDAVCLLTGVKP